MGTVYNIKIAGAAESLAVQNALQSRIDSVLAEVNQIMSTYIEDSEISLYNQHRSIEPMAVSDEFADVIRTSLEIHEISEGAFDITVHPLVQIWGFGSMGPKWTPPADSLIHSILGYVGSEKLTLTKNRLSKEHSDTEIDLAAIAKGYGVDEVARFLIGAGYKDFMVEIGGEVVCRGSNRYGESWQIGIQYPEFTYSTDVHLMEAVRLSEAAMATSGNYRNFFEYEGRLYSHMINPDTGYPVPNLLVSATVVADNCMTADGLATAVMIMGTDRGMKLIESLDNTECYLIRQKTDGTMESVQSSGFGRHQQNGKFERAGIAVFSQP